MNAARIELCRELYEKSGWETDFKWWSHAESDTEFISSDAEHKDDSVDFTAPAYALGDLLRFIPKMISVDEVHYDLVIRFLGDNDMRCHYWSEVARRRLLADNIDHGVIGTGILEDSACAVAIELFNRGILTKK